MSDTTHYTGQQTRRCRNQSRQEPLAKSLEVSERLIASLKMSPPLWYTTAAYCTTRGCSWHTGQPLYGTGQGFLHLTNRQWSSLNCNCALSSEHASGFVQLAAMTY